MRNIKVTCPISCRADVTATFSAVFEAGVLRCKTFVFRWLSQCDYPVIHMLSGPDWPASDAWHIEGWRIVKTPRERMLKWSRKIAIFRNERKLWVPLQREKWRMKSESFDWARAMPCLHELCRAWETSPDRARVKNYHAEWERNWKEIERNDQKWE